jgi:hypothetical protein
MGYVIFSIAGVAFISMMYVAATDYKGIITNVFATKKQWSLGLKAMAGNVRQLRILYFLLGALGTLISVGGITALIRS